MRALPSTPSRRGKGLDARAVLLSSMALILGIKSCLTFQELGWATATLTGIGMVFGIPWRLVLARAVWVLPFCLAALPLAFTTAGPALWVAGPLTISAPGLEKFGVVSGQCLLCLLVVLMAGTVSNPFALVAATGRLGCPQRLVSVLQLCLRYLELLGEELSRLQRARQSRGCQEPGLAFRARVTGQLAGTLFLRSLDRAERVEVAMRSRGAKSTLPVPEPGANWGLAEYLTLGLAITLAGISWYL